MQGIASESQTRPEPAQETHAHTAVALAGPAGATYADPLGRWLGGAAMLLLVAQLVRKAWGRRQVRLRQAELQARRRAPGPGEA